MESKKLLLFFYKKEQNCTFLDGCINTLTSKFEFLDCDFLQTLNKKQMSVLENKILNKKRISSTKSMRFMLRHKFKKYTNLVMSFLQEKGPDLIICNNYFFAFASFEYQKLINHNVKIITICQDKNVSSLWDNRSHSFVVFNRSALFEAIGKRKFIPGAVYLFENLDASKFVNFVVDELNRPIVCMFKSHLKNFMYEQALVGNFSTPIRPINYKNQNPNINYKSFVKPSVSVKFLSSFVKPILFVFGPVVNFFGFGLKVRGRKNIKNVKNAIVVCNHVSALDCLWSMQTLRFHNLIITGAPFNWKKGLGGKIMQTGGFVPLPATIEQNKGFDDILGKLLTSGHFVQFYAEQSLWPYYKQSRQYKRGAFHYASKNNVPVIVVTYLFSKHHVMAQIEKPIYPNSSLSTRESSILLQKQAQQKYDETVANFYGYAKDQYSPYKINYSKNNSGRGDKI